MYEVYGLTYKMSELSEYLKDKSISIIGPSPSLIGKKQGSKIDSKDIVIRLNQAVPLDKTQLIDTGSRTDVLYQCLERHPTSGGNLDIDLWLKEGVRRIVCPYPINLHGDDRRIFAEEAKGKIPCDFITMDNYKKICKDMNSKANTGMLAIVHLLQHDIKSLFITGFTFFRDGYMKQYKDWDIQESHKRAHSKNGHRQPPQENYFKKVVAKDPRVEIDETLKEIVNETTPFNWKEYK